MKTFDLPVRCFLADPRLYRFSPARTTLQRALRYLNVGGRFEILEIAQVFRHFPRWIAIVRMLGHALAVMRSNPTAMFRLRVLGAAGISLMT
jgi:hypothetical protein